MSSLPSVIAKVSSRQSVRERSAFKLKVYASFARGFKFHSFRSSVHRRAKVRRVTFNWSFHRYLLFKFTSFFFNKKVHFVGTKDDENWKWSWRVKIISGRTPFATVISSRSQHDEIGTQSSQVVFIFFKLLNLRYVFFSPISQVQRCNTAWWSFDLIAFREVFPDFPFNFPSRDDFSRRPTEKRK